MALWLIENEIKLEPNSDYVEHIEMLINLFARCTAARLKVSYTRKILRRLALSLPIFNIFSLRMRAMGYRPSEYVATKLAHLPSGSHTVWPDAGVHAVGVHQSIESNANIAMVRNAKRKEIERY